MPVAFCGGISICNKPTDRPAGYKVPLGWDRTIVENVLEGGLEGVFEDVFIVC